MPICIAGMHRSGTSLVARMLRICGVHLGAEADFAPPAPDNPGGYWEDLRFVDLDDRVLACLGGAWDVPPAVAPEWPDIPALAGLRGEARRLVVEGGVPEPWGFKDPRASLTAALWRGVCPDLQFVVCVRHPFEVARSLQARGFTSLVSGFELWQAYHQALEEFCETAGVRSVVTHYDSYFGDPHAELARVTAALDLAVPPEAEAAAAAAVKLDARHHRALPGIDAIGLSAAGIRLYARLCERSGPLPVLAGADSAASHAVPVTTPEAALRHSLEAAQEQLAVLQPILMAREDELASVKAVLAARDSELRALHPLLLAREEQLGSVLPVLAARDAEVSALRDLTAARDEQLASVLPVLRAREVELASVHQLLAARERELASVKALLAVREGELASLSQPRADPHRP